ncbi:MAG: FHA domain-containing protein [Phycisphaerae bacterium]|nr:FHA domain-containing protein [Phycisphaerae bacterium]
MDVKLVMFKRDGQRKDFAITQKTTIIGRGEDCTLRIPVVSISRQHCELIKSDDNLLIRDLASSNGTHVNNQRVNESALKAGDRITLGPTTFTVQIDGKPEEIKPARTRSTKSPTEEAEEGILELQSDGDETGNYDPISALEALASDSDDQKQ